MTEEVSNRLKEEFPEYKDVYFEINDGWFNIVQNMFLEFINKNLNVKILQIKEKFGTLRVYANCVGNNDYNILNSIIRDAEIASSLTCDICGGTGHIRNDNHWLKTRCENHLA
jgi:hypothetical protein